MNCIGADSETCRSNPEYIEHMFASSSFHNALIQISIFSVSVILNFILSL